MNCIVLKLEDTGEKGGVCTHAFGFLRPHKIFVLNQNNDVSPHRLLQKNHMCDFCLTPIK